MDPLPMDPLQEMLSNAQRPLPGSPELQRLLLLLDGADKQLRKTESDVEQSQLDSGQGRVEYFEKLTIGSGAAIAALVSFLGSHSATLHPRWILRSSLILLGLTMLAGLFRNFRYPNYVMQIRKISWIRSSRYQQRCKCDCIKANPATQIDIHTGQLINIAQTIKGLEESDVELGRVVKEQERKGERLRKQWAYAEWFCLASVVLSMASLIWLALSNF
jgi:hypothetical protein